ncbi:DUF4132 domain-containing protein [Actinomadura viridis]|uniref:DUF4132 domain-containing protein n=1 Tax=Actinomadura viridis TaxID=58110 RepID=UPI003689F568
MEERTPLPSLPDEDTLVLPEGWHRYLDARRGGAPGPRIKVTARADAKVQEYMAQAKDALDAFLAGRHGDLALTGQARAHLDGAADPAGAAAVALITHRGQEYPPDHRETAAFFAAFFDSWVAAYGLGFAAVALVELNSIEHVRRGTGPWKGSRLGVEYRAGDVFKERVRECARRARGLLAVATDAEYREAVERLGGVRDAIDRRLAAAYLVPTESAWVQESCAERPSGWRYNDQRWSTLLRSLGTAEDLAAMGTTLQWGDATVGLLATLADGLGRDLLPLLVDSFDTSYLESADRKRLLEVMALLPTDEAFEALIERIEHKQTGPALLAAMNRFPARAIRLLAAARARGGAGSKTGTAVTALLTGHLLAHAEIAEAVVPGLPEESRAVIASVVASSERIADAPAGDLPRLLVEPPWTLPRKAAKPLVVKGLEVPAVRALHWAEGEREAWAASPVPPAGRFEPEDGWEEVVARFHKMSSWEQSSLIATGPEDVVRPLLGRWGGFLYWDAEDVPWMKSVVARYEEDALRLALMAARANPGTCAKLLLPYLDAEVATRMAEWLVRVKSARQSAMSWFGRHGAAAARLLTPAALGKAGPERRRAEAALVMIASRSGAEEIVAAAREHGDSVADAIAALLATDPLDRLPAKMPERPDWTDPVRLPQVLLRGRERALPVEATGHLVTMLAMSKPGEVYAGVEVVRELCDPESLAEFSWALFEQWEQQGAPSADGWALAQLAWFGDDETVRRLTPVIRAWPGDGGHKKAVNGLDVLAEIGSDVALLHLHGISEKVKFKGLRARAQEKIAEVAAGLGLSAEELADRLVPDFGLDADGSLVLDYGPRRFVVGFDEQLKPFVTDEDGKLRKALPKPGVKDDQEPANEAYKRFAGLKKDVRAVAADQVRRLETAMVTRRRWTAEEFRTFFVDHPLIWHVARRLVWLAEDGGRAVAFRVVEDRTFADAEDDALTLPANASIGIAHPLDLDGETSRWSEVFADYEILQPFPQLGRDVHRLTEQERASGRLERFEGTTVPVHAVVGLVRRGWERGVPLDAGGERWISRPVPGGLHIVIDLDPGISVGYVNESDDQSLRVVWINDRPTDFWPRHGTRRTFGELDPVTASEVLADLTWLSGSAL